MTWEKRAIWDWDDIFSQSTAERCYSLTDQQKEALLMIFPQIQWSTRWENDGNYTKDQIDAFIAELGFRLLNDGDCVTPEEGDCIAHPSSHSMVTYSPQNPFSEPSLVPSGYLTPPFTQFANFAIVGWLSTWLPDFTESLTGYDPDDIIVDISSLPLVADWQDLTSNLMPQIAIDVTGIGIVELHLLNFPLGGRALITVDAQPNLSDVFLGILGNAETSVELNRDLLSLPIESASLNIQEIEITDTGNHTIYITFVPVVDDALIPLNFGGGFRKVVTCGLDTEIMPIVEDIRLNGCTLEKMVGGAWIASGDVLADCVQASIDGLQAQIDSNDVDILNLQNYDSAQDALIVQNQVDIDALEVDVAQKTLTLNDHETRITDIETDIAQKTLTLNDHETRITTLENADPGGGGGGGDIVALGHDSVWDTGASRYDIGWISWDAINQLDITFTPKQNNVFIRVIYVLDMWSTDNINTDFRVHDGLGNYVQCQRHTGNTGEIYENITIIADFFSVSPVERTFSLERIMDANFTVWAKGRMTGHALEVYKAPELTNSPLVTFDAGGYPYIYDATGTILTNVGVDVGSGGVTGGCAAAQNVDFPNGICVGIDLGAVREISNVVFSKFADQANGYWNVYIYYDGSVQSFGWHAGNIASYETFDAAAFLGASWVNQNAQYVQVCVTSRDGYPIPNLRVDDIQVMTV